MVEESMTESSMTESSVSESDSLEQARAAFFEGVEHFEAQRLSQAEVAFARALVLTPERASVMINLGVTRVHLGQYSDALAPLEAGVLAEPQSPDGWGALAHARFELGLWATALAAYERAFEQGTDSLLMRLQFAKCQFRLGAYEAAERAYRNVLALDEHSAEAWYQLGELQREIGQYPQAIDSYQQALTHGADATLVHYVLSALGERSAVLTPPRAYVQGLFDQYADDFEHHLVEQLGYRGHRVLIEQFEQLPAVGAARFERVLDLGCGTGLCGALLRARSEHLVGVDLSAAMIEKSRLLGLYDDLAALEVHEFLSQQTTTWDLVVAADVFIYVGALERLFELLSARLRPGAWLAFTAESAEQGQGVQLLPSLRYAHAFDYLYGLARLHGFRVESVQEATIRVHAGEAMMGRYWYLQKNYSVPLAR